MEGVVNDVFGPHDAKGGQLKSWAWVGKKEAEEGAQLRAVTFSGVEKEGFSARTVRPQRFHALTI